MFQSCNKREHYRGLHQGEGRYKSTTLLHGNSRGTVCLAIPILSHLKLTILLLTLLLLVLLLLLLLMLLMLMFFTAPAELDALHILGQCTLSGFAPRMAALPKSYRHGFCPVRRPISIMSYKPRTHSENGTASSCLTRTS